MVIQSLPLLQLLPLMLLAIAEAMTANRTTAITARHFDIVGSAETAVLAEALVAIDLVIVVAIIVVVLMDVVVGW